MAHGDAEVDQRLPLPLRVPAVDVGRADLELQGRRHAVGRLQGVIGGILAVRMQVDEPGRYHEAPHVEDRPAAQVALGDGLDPTAVDADRADRVELRFRVDHTPVQKDDVVAALGGLWGASGQEQQKEGEVFHAGDLTPPPRRPPRFAET